MSEIKSINNSAVFITVYYLLPGYIDKYSIILFDCTFKSIACMASHKIVFFLRSV